MTVKIQINVNHGDLQHEEVITMDGGAFSPLDKVLMDFNVTQDKRVMVIKALCAGLVHNLRKHHHQMAEKRGEHMRGSLEDHLCEARQETSLDAIKQIEIAQMLAVKAFFAKP